MLLGSTFATTGQILLRSCTDGTCDECDIGNSGMPEGGSYWADLGFPQCMVYSGASFDGAQEVGSSREFIFIDKQSRTAYLEQI
jgi:hypothetical protein